MGNRKSAEDASAHTAGAAGASGAAGAAGASGNIVRGEDGVYRWVYEFNLLTNPTILITVLKLATCIHLQRLFAGVSSRSVSNARPTQRPVDGANSANGNLTCGP